MKTKITSALIILFLFHSLFVDGQIKTLTLIIKSATDSSQNKIQNNLGEIKSADEIQDWKINVDNPKALDFFIKVQSQKKIIQLPIDKKKKLSFGIKNNILIKNDQEKLTIGEDLSIEAFDQDGKTLKKETIFSVKNKSNNDVPHANSGYKIGIIYYDAVFLADPNGDKAVKSAILKYYGIGDTKALNKTNSAYDSLSTAQQSLIDAITEKPVPPGQQSGNSQPIISSILSSVGNYDVTNIADGIARFLVTRVKEELSIAFFQHFKDVLNKEPTSDLQYLFPVTYDILNSMDQEIYNWDNYINLLREGFDKDISNLVPNLESFEANASLLKAFRKSTVNHVSARVGFYIAKGFINHVQAGQLLDDFNAEEYIQPTEEEKNDPNVKWIAYNLQNSVKSLQLISSSLRTRDTSEYWISDSEFRELLNNDVLFNHYSLLLSLEARKEGIRFQKEADGKVFVFLQDLISHVNRIKPVINGFVVKVKDFRSSYAKMKIAIDNAKTDSAKSKISYTDVYPFIQSSIGILKYTDESLLKLKIDSAVPGMKNILYKTDTIIDILSKGGELGMDISLKRYNAAIADITYIINRTKKSAPVNPVVVDENGLKKITENLVKYGTFMASVANAKTSEEVKKVIENFALPAGSARIKRTSAFNVSVNAYPGIYGGYEKIKGVDPNWDGSFNSYGVTAPIGIAASCGQRNFLCMGKRNWSYSLFLSLIDVGAVAAFRFQNDTVESVPTIKLKDIIAPGAFFSIGIPKCPLSLNVGVQLGPNLREITSSPDSPDLKNDYSSNIYWRYSISLCVDIPILNLANRTDRRNND
jgi:hypothetical protein